MPPIADYQRGLPRPLETRELLVGGGFPMRWSFRRAEGGGQIVPSDPLDCLARISGTLHLLQGDAGGRVYKLVFSSSAVISDPTNPVLGRAAAITNPRPLSAGDGTADQQRAPILTDPGFRPGSLRLNPVHGARLG